MAELKNNVVPVIVLDDDDEYEISVGGSASEAVRLDKKKDDVGKSEEHKFVVGDLVWCKLKDDPWMPAQVYDPKDASYTVNGKKEGMLYVVLFDSATCAWCVPEQLSPFVDHFVQNSEVCNSKFPNAVQKAVDEFQRIVESSMVCKCVPESQKRGLARPVSNVYGEKEVGVLVPEVDINRIPVPKFEPYDVLADVRHVAKTLAVGNKLHLATLKSSLSAFYRSKGYPLALYHKPRKIRAKKMKTLDEIMRVSAKVESKGEGSKSVGKQTRKRKVEPLESREQKEGIVRKKKKKSLPSQLILSTAVTTTSDMETSFIDGVKSDVKDVMRELAVMTDILEENQTTYSVEEKASLKEDIKQILESVQILGEKVNTASVRR